MSIHRRGRGKKLYKRLYTFPPMVRYRCRAPMLVFSPTDAAVRAVLLMLDRDTQRVDRLFDITKSLRLTPGYACVAGSKVNSVNTLYLVIESVRLNTKPAARPALQLSRTAQEDSAMP